LNLFIFYVLYTVLYEFNFLPFIAVKQYSVVLFITGCDNIVDIWTNESR
jgi:hypothetical protein